MSLTLGDAGPSTRPSSPIPRINHSESTSATTISRRREVSVDPPTLPLSNVPLETRTARKPSCNIPYDIAEMIIALTLDLRDLKACSLTCHSWYIAAIPHLHRTLTLRGNSKVIRDKLKPLPELHELGLIPLVKELRVEQEYHLGGWFVPQAFSHNDLRCFSAFKNVHTLKLRRVEIYRFIPVINRYFGSFSPTLRSIALYNPNCTPQQLSHFLSFFLNLEDIEIERINTSVPDTTVPDTELFPFPIPRLQGRLALRDFRWAETWTSLIASCGGLRFRHIDLRANVTCAPALLEACAGTLETLRFHAMDVTYRPLDLSRLRVLRSLQVTAWVGGYGHAGSPRHALVTQVFSTITSPVFSELAIVVTSDTVINLPLDAPLFDTLCKMNEARPFKLVFLPEASYSYQEKVRLELERVLEVVKANGFLDFSTRHPLSVNPPPRMRSSPSILDKVPPQAL